MLAAPAAAQARVEFGAAEVFETEQVHSAEFGAAEVFETEYRQEPVDAILRVYVARRFRTDYLVGEHVLTLPPTFGTRKGMRTVVDLVSPEAL